MTVQELKALLSNFPDDMPVKLLPNNSLPMLSVDNKAVVSIVDLTADHFLQTTDKAYVDSDAPEDEWDCEDGKIIYDGMPFLLVNPIIT